MRGMRLTHERVSGMKSGYWSPANKDKLIDALAKYEDTELSAEEVNELKAFKWHPINPDEHHSYPPTELTEEGYRVSDYLLLSCNYTLPFIGRYEEHEGGGFFYCGDNEEPLSSMGIFVNAWMPVPPKYEEE